MPKLTKNLDADVGDNYSAFILGKMVQDTFEVHECIIRIEITGLQINIL